MLPEIVKKMPWTDDFEVDDEHLTVRLRQRREKPPTSSTAAFASVINTAIDNNVFETLHGKHSELYPVLGARHPVQFERFAGDLFGFIARGAHLTIYTVTDRGMMIWVPRRSPHMFTYPNKLDTTVAGGVPAHQTPFENVIQEADEEASLPSDLIKRDVRAAGALTYMGLSSESNGAKESLIVSDVVYVYDLAVGQEVKPIPKDDEVKEFYLMSVDEVKAALARGEFKTNSAVVMIDFFVRHGIITADNEPDYVEIVTRMHRKLPFPTTG